MMPGLVCTGVESYRMVTPYHSTKWKWNLICFTSSSVSHLILLFPTFIWGSRTATTSVMHHKHDIPTNELHAMWTDIWAHWRYFLPLKKWKCYKCYKWPWCQLFAWNIVILWTFSASILYWLCFKPKQSRGCIISSCMYYEGRTDKQNY